MELPADRHTVREPVRQAHGPEQRRGTHDPEPFEIPFEMLTVLSNIEGLKAPNEIEGEPERMAAPGDLRRSFPTQSHYNFVYGIIYSYNFVVYESRGKSVRQPQHLVLAGKQAAPSNGMPLAMENRKQ
jgi:hypothetical protein